MERFRHRGRRRMRVHPRRPPAWRTASGGEGNSTVTPCRCGTAGSGRAALASPGLGAVGRGFPRQESGEPRGAIAARLGQDGAAGRERNPGAKSPWRPEGRKKGLAVEAASRHADGMDQTPQLAAQIAPWLTPVVVLTVLGLMWRSMLRLEDRLGKRIDDTSAALGKRIDDASAALGKRIDDTSAALGKRIDDTNRRIDGLDGRLRTIENTQAEIKGKLDFVEAYMVGRNDARTAAAE